MILLRVDGIHLLEKMESKVSAQIKKMVIKIAE